ncbi:hypothetical protein ACO1GT_04345 [Staphylococcus arlettae]
MKGNKKIAELLELYDKKLSKLFKYNKKKAMSFDKDSRLQLQEKYGIYVIFNAHKKPVFVGQAGGYLNNHQRAKKDLCDKLGQYNLKSDAGTLRFKRAYALDNDLVVDDAKAIKAEDYNLKVQYIEVKENPALINILETLALEYAKEKDFKLYNFYKK